MAEKKERLSKEQNEKLQKGVKELREAEEILAPYVKPIKRRSPNTIGKWCDSYEIVQHADAD